MDHFTGVAAKQGVPESEASGRHLRRDLLVKVQRHGATLSPALFNHAKATAGWPGVHERVKEGPVDGQNGKHAGHPNNGLSSQWACHVACSRKERGEYTSTDP